MKIYCVSNQKGGVGKTTTATALASILRNNGYRTLLIDADQQGNSTDTYHAEFDGVATLYDVLLDPHPIKLIDAVQHTEFGDIVASDPLLSEGDSRLSGNIDGDYRLSDAIENLGDAYDYIIIDTAPALNHILYNVLFCANEIIIPITTDRYGLQGLSQLSGIVCNVQKRQNPGLKISGLLLIKYNPRTRLSKETVVALTRIASEMNTKLFKTTIRESVKAREAQAKRRPLINYDSSCSTAQDYMKFVNELMEGDK